jgi:hypothetical protein
MEYTKKQSKAKIGSIPWNKGKTYEEIKGKEWSDNFSKKSSLSKKGKPNIKNRRTTARGLSYNHIRKLMKTVLYISWIRPILERDGFSCTMCGCTKHLEVHHKKPFKKIIEEASVITGLDLGKHNKWKDDDFVVFRNVVMELHKIDDGITLCKECHKKIDRYRRRLCKNEGNTPEQPRLLQLC